MRKIKIIISIIATLIFLEFFSIKPTLAQQGCNVVPQEPEIVQNFCENLRQARSDDPQSETRYRLVGTEGQEYYPILDTYNLKGWKNVILRNLTVPAFWSLEWADTIQKTQLLHYEDLMKRQVATLDTLAVYFNWARDIVVRNTNLPQSTQEEIVLSPSSNMCLGILDNFSKEKNRFTLPGHPDATLKNIIDRGIALNTIDGTIVKTGIARFNRTRFILNFPRIRELNRDDNFISLKNQVTNFTPVFGRLLSDFQNIRNDTQVTYQKLPDLTKSVTNENQVQQFEEFVRQIINSDTRLIPAGFGRERCFGLLSTILTGKTLGNRIATEQEITTQGIINDMNVAHEQISAITLKFTPGQIEVEVVKMPIAVAPPDLFGREFSSEELSPTGIVDKIEEFILNLAPFLFILLVVIGGIFYLLNVFHPQYLQAGKNWIWWAIAGYVILLIASAIITLLESIVGPPK
jgi:hypothetical protein